jgi:hypothetical protein
MAIHRPSDRTSSASAATAKSTGSWAMRRSPCPKVTIRNRFGCAPAGAFARRRLSRRESSIRRLSEIPAAAAAALARRNTSSSSLIVVRIKMIVKMHIAEIDYPKNGCGPARHLDHHQREIVCAGFSKSSFPSDEGQKTVAMTTVSKAEQGRAGAQTRSRFGREKATIALPDR